MPFWWSCTFEIGGPFHNFAENTVDEGRLKLLYVVCYTTYSASVNFCISCLELFLCGFHQAFRVSFQYVVYVVGEFVADF